MGDNISSNIPSNPPSPSSSTALAASLALTPRETSRLHTVASGLLNVYRTLQRMRYLHPSWIHPGPHDITSLLPLYNSLSLSPSTIYLYSILPYVEAPSEYMGFFQGGTFVDFRKEDDVQWGRDPLNTDGEEKYEGESEMMRGWMTPLSRLGNDSTVVFYDAERHQIGMFDPMNVGSMDPWLHPWDRPEGYVEGGEGDEVEEEEEDGNGDGDGDDDDDDDDEGGEGEEEGGEEGGGDEEDEEDDEDEDMDGKTCRWDEWDGRPAAQVLRDMVKWYEDLIETPGGGENTPLDWDSDIVVPLYRKHGWPGEGFDGDAFEVDHKRVLAVAEIRDKLEEPISRVKNHRASVEYYRGPRMESAQKHLERADTVDQQWLERWEVRCIEKQVIDEEKRLKAAEERMEVLCPGGRMKDFEDLPLLELRMLANQLEEAKDYIDRKKKEVEEPYSDSKWVIRELRLDLDFAQRTAVITKNAYEAAKLDAERLCPGRSLPPTEEIELKEPALDLAKSLETWNEKVETHRENIKDCREWMARLPEEASVTRGKLEENLQQEEERLKSALGQQEEAMKAIEVK